MDCKQISGEHSSEETLHMLGLWPRPFYSYLHNSENLVKNIPCNYICFYWDTARSAQRDPPRLVLEVGGTSALQAAVPGELKSPPTWNLEVGGTSTLQAQLPARLKSPPLQAQVWGGSRWADLAVNYQFMDICRLKSR